MRIQSVIVVAAAFAILTMGSSASAAGGPASENREELVRAAHRAMPVLLNYVMHLKDSEKLTASERATLKKIAELASRDSIPLIFSEDRSSFQLKEGESERLMRSTAVHDTETGENISDGEIYVNRARLNELEPRPDLTRILKLLFHELGHKTKEENWGLRDRLAQYFENQISPYISEKELGRDSTLIVLSLPFAKIDNVLGPVKQTEPQRTNVVLLRVNGSYHDLTPRIYERTAVSTTLMRSMWTEANRAIYEVYKVIGGALHQAMGPVLEQFFKPFIASFGGDTSQVDQAMDGIKMDLSELRVLEIHEAVGSVFENEMFLSLRATYNITRTDKMTMPIQVTGFPWTDSYPVPVTIQILVPTGPGLSEPQVDMQIRPSADYSIVGKVFEVRREAGVISSFKVKIPNTGEDVRTASLITHFGMGHLTLAATRIEIADKDMIEVSFEVPREFYPPNTSLVADTLILNQEKTVFLNRMITLSDDAEGAQFIPRSAGGGADKMGFVEDSVGLWGLRKGVPAFRTHFEFKDPIYILDNVNMDRFSLNHSRINVEFKLKKEQKIREVRLYLKRNLMKLDVAREPREVQEVDIEGRRIRFADGGRMLEQRDVHDITSANAEDIYSAYLPGGIQKVRATLSVPLRNLEKPVGPTEAFAPPLGNPVLLEVVTEDLQTLRHYFEDPEKANCEDLLDTFSIN